jgi:hypothetical protein
MSSLNDRRQSILGRRRTVDPTTKPKRVRAPRLTKPAVTVNPGDPQAWKEFKPNTLAYARLWLKTGELPDEIHFVIRERLAPWIAVVQAGGDDLRATLLAVVPAIEPRVPVPTREWIMPTRNYSPEPPRQIGAETDEETCEGSRGCVTRLQDAVRHPPPSVTHQEGGIVPFPLPTDTRQCQVCGKPFSPYRERAVFCSNRCRQSAYRKKQAA